MLYEKFPEQKYKYRNREFWCRGYYVDTAGKNAKKIQEYIQCQYEQDKAGEQLTMSERSKVPVYGRQIRDFRGWQTVLRDVTRVLVF